MSVVQEGEGDLPLVHTFTLQDLPHTVLQELAGNVPVASCMKEDGDHGSGTLPRVFLAGLKLPRKMISPKYFYDDHGSKLFDRICETPEYYPTRTEAALLRDNAEAIIADFPAYEPLLPPPNPGDFRGAHLVAPDRIRLRRA